MANFLKDDSLFYDDGYDDMYDDGIVGSDGEPLGEEFDDGVVDSLIILFVAAAIVALVWYRNARQQAHRQAEQNAARAGEGGPGMDPFRPLGAGGIGH